MPNLSSAHASLSPHGEHAMGAALCVLSMSSIQFGAALSAPVMTELGVLPTSWLRLSWAAIALLLWARPPLHRFKREQWVGWEAYMRSWLGRKNFLTEWERTKHEFDPAFVGFLDKMIAASGKIN